MINHYDTCHAKPEGEPKRHIQVFDLDGATVYQCVDCGALEIEEHVNKQLKHAKLMEDMAAALRAARGQWHRIQGCHDSRCRVCGDVRKVLGQIDAALAAYDEEAGSEK